MRQAAPHNSQGHQQQQGQQFTAPAAPVVYQVRIWLSKTARKPATFRNRNRDVIENLYRSALRARMRAEAPTAVSTPPAL